MQRDRYVSTNMSNGASSLLLGGTLKYSCGTMVGVVVACSVSISEVKLRLARLVLGWVTYVQVHWFNLSLCVTSHPGQLSLAIPWVGFHQYRSNRRFTELQLFLTVS